MVYLCHNCIKSLGLGELSYDVYRDNLPAPIWYLVWHEFSSLPCWERLHPLAGVASSYIPSHIARESWPPVVPRYKLQCFPPSWVSCYWGVMMGMDNVMA